MLGPCHPRRCLHPHCAIRTGVAGLAWAQLFPKQSPTDTSPTRKTILSEWGNTKSFTSRLPNVVHKMRGSSFDIVDILSYWYKYPSYCILGYQSPERGQNKWLWSKSASKVYKHGFNMRWCASIHCLLDIFKDSKGKQYFWQLDASNEELMQLGRKWILGSDEPEFKSLFNMYDFGYSSSLRLNLPICKMITRTPYTLEDCTN